MNARALLLIVSCLGALGCSDNFDSPSLVIDLRVLALQADPPEYVYPTDGNGVPKIEEGEIPALPASKLTMLVANPEGGKVSYVVKGCVLDSNLACDPTGPVVEFGKGESEPGELSVNILVGQELVEKSIEADMAHGIFGFVVWIAGEVTSGDQSVPFVKSFLFSPDFGVPKVPNSNPEISELRTGEKDKEVPLSVGKDGFLAAKRDEAIRFLPVIPEEDREDYTIRNFELKPVDMTEEMTVSFFATCGTFGAEAKSEVLNVAFETEEDKEDKDLGVEWTAPSEDGPCTLWFVAADGRGGIGWRKLVVMVGP